MISLAEGYFTLQVSIWHDISFIMKKSQKTYQKIIDAALKRSVEIGLEGISFAMIAEMAGISKSGMFAHFSTKEQLQEAVVEEAMQRFQKHVVIPALKSNPGLDRLKALQVNHLKWIAGDHEAGGCPFITYGQEYDDKPGSIRNLLATSNRQWDNLLEANIEDAKKNEELPDNLDSEQLIFELNGSALAFQTYLKLMDNTSAYDKALSALERLVAK